MVLWLIVLLYFNSLLINLLCWFDVVFVRVVTVWFVLLFDLCLNLFCFALCGVLLIT